MEIFTFTLLIVFTVFFFLMVSVWSTKDFKNKLMVSIFLYFGIHGLMSALSVLNLSTVVSESGVRWYIITATASAFIISLIWRNTYGWNLFIKIFTMFLSVAGLTWLFIN